MRKKFSIKLNILPNRHREVKIFILQRYSNMEEGLNLAVQISLDKCKSRAFRKQFIKLPAPFTGANKESKEQAYWLDYTLKQPVAEMCETFRKEFGFSTITFGRNAFLYRAIHYFMDNHRELSFTKEK